VAIGEKHRHAEKRMKLWLNHRHHARRNEIISNGVNLLAANLKAFSKASGYQQ
jgi:hypothetical protein